MTRTLVAAAALLLALPAAGGCMKDTRASAMTPFLVAADQNPDVIWVAREVIVDDEQNFWGLFACYRKPASTPGPPTCYLAEISADLRHLSWPGDVRVRNGQLRGRRDAQE